jgi:hypothetical protein
MGFPRQEHGHSVDPGRQACFFAVSLRSGSATARHGDGRGLASVEVPTGLRP